jgi:hypothetical protein
LPEREEQIGSFPLLFISNVQATGIGRTATDIMKSVAAFKVAMLCPYLGGSP